MPLANCPECAAELHVDEDIDKGQMFHCEECDSTLEVVGLDPIELDVAAEADDEEFDDDKEDEF